MSGKRKVILDLDDETKSIYNGDYYIGTMCGNIKEYKEVVNNATTNNTITNKETIVLSLATNGYNAEDIINLKNNGLI